MQLNYSPPVHIYRWVVAVIIQPASIKTRQMSSAAVYLIKLACR
jgi:hypothetical protein